MERNQNKFNETGPLGKNIKEREHSVNRRGMMGYRAKQTDQFLIRKVEITIEMFYINKL